MEALLNSTEAHKQASDFLSTQYFMSIATIGKEGCPHVSTVVYFIDKDLNFYFLTNKNTRKVEDLFHNEQIGGEVHNVPEWYVQFRGTITALDEDETNKVIDLFAERANEFKDFWPPLFMQKNITYVAFKIQPKWLRLTDLSNMNISATQPPIYTIIDNE